MEYFYLIFENDEKVISKRVSTYLLAELTQPNFT